MIFPSKQHRYTFKYFRDVGAFVFLGVGLQKPHNFCSAFGAARRFPYNLLWQGRHGKVRNTMQLDLIHTHRDFGKYCVFQRTIWASLSFCVWDIYVCDLLRQNATCGSEPRSMVHACVCMCTCMNLNIHRGNHFDPHVKRLANQVIVALPPSIRIQHWWKIVKL